MVRARPNPPEHRSVGPYLLHRSYPVSSSQEAKDNRGVPWGHPCFARSRLRECRALVTPGATSVTGVVVARGNRAGGVAVTLVRGAVSTPTSDQAAGATFINFGVCPATVHVVTFGRLPARNALSGAANETASSTRLDAAIALP
jgi:hypothetical protein